MKHIDNNKYMSNVNSIICPKGTTDDLFYLYCLYFFPKWQKSCNSGFQVAKMQVLDYFTNSVYTLGLSEDCP